MSYYGLPALKPSPYGWKVALYTFLAGLAGTAQVLSTLFELSDSRHRRSVTKAGRAIAFGTGALAGPVLLIADLHTPRRWYNMLRIFRPTSPMSIGSYVLTAFGAFSAACFTPLRRVAQVPAALAGAGMATYTPALLASTATPLWSTAPRALGAEFATGAFACGAAALVLASNEKRALDSVAGMATLAHTAAVVATGRAHRRAGVDGALRRGRWAGLHKAGVALSIGLPLACYALNAVLGASRKRSDAAAMGILAGVFLSRWALFGAGNETARQPEVSLHAPRS